MKNVLRYRKDAKEQDILLYRKYFDLYRKLRKVKIKDEEGIEIEVDLEGNQEMFYSKIMDLPDEVIKKAESHRRKYTLIKNKYIKYKRLVISNDDDEKGAVNTQNLEFLPIEKRSEIIDLFGRMFSVQEVLEFIINNWQINDVKITKGSLASFYANNANIIKSKISDYKNSYESLRLTAKRSRLEELTTIYKKIKRKHETNNNRADAELMLKVLDIIRRETEGDKLKIESQVKVDLEVNINQTLRLEHFKYLNVKELLLSRLAVMMKVPFVTLMEELHKSHYAKYNSLLKDLNLQDIEEVTNPTNSPYDFNFIFAGIKDADKIAGDDDVETAFEKLKRIRKENVSLQEAENKTSKAEILKKLKEQMSKAEQKQQIIDVKTLDED